MLHNYFIFYHFLSVSLSWLNLSSKSLLGEFGCSWWSWYLYKGTHNISMRVCWKFYLDPTLGTLSRLHLSSKYLPGVLEEIDVLDGAGDGVRLFSWKFNIWNLIKTPPVLSLLGFLEDVDVLDEAGDGVRILIKSIESFTESFIKIKHQEPY